MPATSRPCHLVRQERAPAARGRRAPRAAPPSRAARASRPAAGPGGCSSSSVATYQAPSRPRCRTRPCARRPRTSSTSSTGTPRARSTRRSTARAGTFSAGRSSRRHSSAASAVASGPSVTVTCARGALAQRGAGGGERRPRQRADEERDRAPRRARRTRGHRGPPRPPGARRPAGCRVGRSRALARRASPTPRTAAARSAPGRGAPRAQGARVGGQPAEREGEGRPAVARRAGRQRALEDDLPASAGPGAHGVQRERPAEQRTERLVLAEDAVAAPDLHHLGRAGSAGASLAARAAPRRVFPMPASPTWWRWPARRARAPPRPPRQRA